MSGSGGRLLRVEANRCDEATFLLRGQWRRVVRIRGAVGSLARLERTMDQVMLDLDDGAERCDIIGPRSDACHSQER